VEGKKKLEYNFFARVPRRKAGREKKGYGKKKTRCEGEVQWKLTFQALKTQGGGGSSSLKKRGDNAPVSAVDSAIVLKTLRDQGGDGTVRRNFEATALISLLGKSAVRRFKREIFLQKRGTSRAETNAMSCKGCEGLEPRETLSRSDWLEEREIFLKGKINIASTTMSGIEPRKRNKRFNISGEGMSAPAL